MYNEIKNLKATSNAYQKFIWKILNFSKTNLGKFYNNDTKFLEILTKFLRFSDTGRVCKFHLEIEKEKLVQSPRDIEILIKFGVLNFEVASDEDDVKISQKLVETAIECFESAIKFEGLDINSGDLPKLEFLKSPAETLAAASKPTAAPAAKPAAKSAAKPAAKPPTKTPARGKAPAKPAAKSTAKACSSKEKVASKPASSSSSPPKATKLNGKNLISRLWLAKAFKLQMEITGNDSLKETVISHYKNCLKLPPNNIEANIDLARLIASSEPLLAVDYYSTCLDLQSDSSAIEKTSESLSDSDQSFINSEIVNILLKLKKLDDPRLEKNMISWAKTYGLGMLDKATKLLEDNGKTKILRRVYCAVHGKNEDDPELVQFFNFKCW